MNFNGKNVYKNLCQREYGRKNVQNTTIRKYKLFDILFRNQYIDNLFSHVFLGFTQDGAHLISYASTSDCHQAILDYGHDSIIHSASAAVSAFHGQHFQLYLWSFEPHRGLRLFNRIILFNREYVNENSFILVTQPKHFGASIMLEKSARSLAAEWRVKDSRDLENKNIEIEPTNMNSLLIYACNLDKIGHETPNQRCYKCYLTLIYYETQVIRDAIDYYGPTRPRTCDFRLDLKHELANSHGPFFEPRQACLPSGFILLRLADALIAFRPRLTDTVGARISKENVSHPTKSTRGPSVESRSTYYSFRTLTSNRDSYDSHDETEARNTENSRNPTGNDTNGRQDEIESDLLSRYLDFGVATFDGTPLELIKDNQDPSHDPSIQKDQSVGETLNERYDNSSLYLKVEQRLLDIEAFLSNFIDETFFASSSLHPQSSHSKVSYKKLKNSPPSYHIIHLEGANDTSSNDGNSSDKNMANNNGNKKKGGSFVSVNRYLYKSVVVYDYDTLVLEDGVVEKFDTDTTILDLDLEFLLKVSYTEYSPYDYENSSFSDNANRSTENNSPNSGANSQNPAANWNVVNTSYFSTNLRLSWDFGSDGVAVNKGEPVDIDGRKRLYLKPVLNHKFWGPSHGRSNENSSKTAATKHFVNDNFHTLSNISLLKGKSINSIRHPSNVYSITL
ncbi:unnamed protein product [Gordionus sp. m RMFG-2023]|uniref:uncharacterized protein LOC135929099 n=1 Tax=Gordionus sp. m RMFG-2023 TaxID=3053472 RepID=UPI0030E1376F